MPTDFDNRDEFDDRGDFDDSDDFPDSDDFGDSDEDEDVARLPWPPPPPPGVYPPPPGGGRAARRGWLLAATAALAAAAGFGVAALALHDATPGAAPGASASASPPSAGSGSQPQPFPRSGGVLPAPGPGQQEHLEIGGKVTAVSPTSITVGGGAGQPVTAAVTAATKVTGKVSSIGGVRVGDVVAVSITGTDGKLTATSIQDPASLP